MPHADGLGVNFDQLRQGVLQAAGNGHGGTQGHIVLREFLRRQLGSGIDRGAGLADHHVRDPLGNLPQKVGHKHLRFVGGGSVANRDDADPVFFDKLFTFFLGRANFILRRGRINHRRIQNLSGAIDHRQLAAGAISRVQAEGNGVFDRRLHEKLLQIHPKNPNRLFGGLLGQGAANLPFQRGKNQTGKAVEGSVPHKTGTGRRLFYKIPDDCFAAPVKIRFQRDLQHIFPFAAVDGQNPVGRDFRHRLGIIVVHGVDRVLRAFSFGFYGAMHEQIVAQSLS